MKFNFVDFNILNKKFLAKIIRKLKPIMPKSLYGRFLLILITPIILIQIITTIIFYKNHWDSLTRSMSSSFAGEVSLITNGIEGIAIEERDEILKASKKYMNMEAYMEKSTLLNKEDNIDDEYKVLVKNLNHRIENDFAIFEDSGNSLKLSIQIENDLLNIVFSNKRVASSTTYIFVMWVIGSAIIMILIATLFLKGQVRSVLNLSKAAESFGKGAETEDFKPSGSKEIRGAGVAFIEMKERIKRLLDTRTQMLAGVSHDLKTPLTRMKLSISMLDNKEKAEELNIEVIEMNKMIEGYLNFAQLDNHDHLTEKSISVDLRYYLQNVVSRYSNHSNEIVVNIPENINLTIKPDYFGRAICNLIDNACKYASNVLVRAQMEENKFIHIFIDDDGEGISEDKMEEVFQPFTRIDESRNSDTGGVGLGLSITRDIVHKHGGEIKLSKSHLGGLRATITLPG